MLKCKFTMGSGIVSVERKEVDIMELSGWAENVGEHGR